MGPHPAVAECRRAVRDLLRDLSDGELVLVACSGGADSLALAAATAFEAPRARLRAGGITVDHGLQPGSAERAAAVAVRMKSLGLEPAEAVTVSVGRAGGPEAAARRARYGALDEAAERLGAVAVLLGHTRDDQAETVLLGLARGSGARSLAAMAPISGGGRCRRPFLGIGRDTTQAACEAEGLDPWSDPHNSDISYARVRVRRDALPALERALGPGVVGALARTAAQLRDDADALDAWAQDVFVRAAGGVDGLRVTAGEGGSDSARPVLETAVLEAVPAAVRRRVLRLAALAAGCPATDLFAVHVDALDALVTAWHGQRHVDLPGSVKARREYGRLVIARAYDTGGSKPSSERCGDQGTARGSSGREGHGQ
jgi:tRNA(Ile)-lysidine synthase